MQLGLIGLGKMGGGIARRLLRHDHEPIGYDRDEGEVAELEAAGGRGARSYAELADALTPPRHVWLMVPAGPIVDSVLEELIPHLDPGDCIVDGGNSFYQDSMRRAEACRREHDLHYVDCGVSGGVWGLEGGYCLMVGGAPEPVERLRPVFEALAPAPDRGWDHLGPVGAGHFTKMIHNGIEYGLMQAYAEGFALLNSKTEFGLDLHRVAQVWQHGSVIRSWLLELTERALEEDASLSEVAPYVQDSGMGRWTAKEALDQNVPAPVLTTALIQRIQSRDDVGFYHRLLSALRNQFGGHAMQAAESPRAGEAEEQA